MAGFQPKGHGPSDPMWQCPSTPKVTFGSRLHPSTKQVAKRHAEADVRNEHGKGACGWHPCCEVRVGQVAELARRCEDGHLGLVPRDVKGPSEECGNPFHPQGSHHIAPDGETKKLIRNVLQSVIS